MSHMAPIDAVTLRETLSEHFGVATDLNGFDVMTEEERIEFMYGDLNDAERQRFTEHEAGMLIVVAEMHKPPREVHQLDVVEEEQILCSQTSSDTAQVPVYSYRSAAKSGLYFKVFVTLF